MTETKTNIRKFSWLLFVRRS